MSHAPCDVFHQMGNLILKLFFHYDYFIIKKVIRFDEMAGENVILSNRLMENSIDASEYILFTENVKEIFDLDYFGETESRTEDCTGLGKSHISVLCPDSNIIENKKIKKIGFIKKVILR